MIVNGKKYEFWGQFVEDAKRWLGGTLTDYDTEFGGPHKTKITSIDLKPNGEESAMFSVSGEDFGCGCDVKSLGFCLVDQTDDDKEVVFRGYGEHTWSIREPD